MCLASFDVVLLCTATRWTECDAKLMRQLRAAGVPFFIVRTKMDDDVVNGKHDHGKTSGALTLTLTTTTYRLPWGSPAAPCFALHVYRLTVARVCSNCF